MEVKTPNHVTLMDYLVDHYAHFQALPMEYAEYDGDAEIVFDFDEYMPFITDQDMDKIKRAKWGNCICIDTECGSHWGQACGYEDVPITTLYRIDMEDLTGSDMCEECADDAMGSGLFTDTKETQMLNQENK